MFVTEHKQLTLCKACQTRGREMRAIYRQRNTKPLLNLACFLVIISGHIISINSRFYTGDASCVWTNLGKVLLFV